MSDLKIPAGEKVRQGNVSVGKRQRGKCQRGKMSNRKMLQWEMSAWKITVFFVFRKVVLNNNKTTLRYTIGLKWTTKRAITNDRICNRIVAFQLLFTKHFIYNKTLFTNHHVYKTS